MAVRIGGQELVFGGNPFQDAVEFGGEKFVVIAFNKDYQRTDSRGNMVGKLTLELYGPVDGVVQVANDPEIDPQLKPKRKFSFEETP